MFELRNQLKTQYRAVQTAQVMERKAEQSKKRFVSYSEHIGRWIARGCDF